MNEVTRILNDVGENTADRLLPIVYDELRRLAADRMSAEKPGQTLTPTGLVHEAWLRLVDAEADWDSRGHFFGAAAEAMRRILIDNARRKQAVKHGGDRHRAQLDLELIEVAAPDGRLLDLDAALTRFGEIDKTKAELVKLRYFAGCSIKDAAELLGISTATADRYWAYSRAWLQTEMNAQAR